MPTDIFDSPVFTMTMTKRTVQKVSTVFLLDTRVNFLAAPLGAAPPEGPGLEAGAGADGRHRQVIIPGQKRSPARCGVS